MTKYAYEGETIKLNERDFLKMLDLYQNLDLRVELDQLDMEIRGEKKWFMTLNAKLNYRNKNAPKRQRTSLEHDLNNTDWANNVVRLK